MMPGGWPSGQLYRGFVGGYSSGSEPFEVGLHNYGSAQGRAQRMTEANFIAIPPLPRLIAVVLATVGAFWGVFLVLALGPDVLLSVPFAVGYLVTAGYIVRVVTTPALGVRRLIWGASILVQGAWLCVGVVDLGRRGADLVFWWWAFATLASVVAIASERDTADTPRAGES
jgi:hypothetical protein